MLEGALAHPAAAFSPRQVAMIALRFVKRGERVAIIFRLACPLAVLAATVRAGPQADDRSKGKPHEREKRLHTATTTGRWVSS